MESNFNRRDFLRTAGALGGLALTAPFAGCRITDATGDWNFSYWFVPGRIYALTNDMIVVLPFMGGGFFSTETPDEYHKQLSEHPERASYKLHVAAAGTRISLTHVEHVDNIGGHSDDAYARIVSGPYKGNEVRITDLTNYLNGINANYLMEVK